MHLVCFWIENSPAVAMNHYLQVTEADFKQAAQNQAQQPAGKQCDAMRQTEPLRPESSYLPENPSNCIEMPPIALAGRGE